MSRQTRVVDGRVELWIPWPLPGGWVCGEPDDTQPDGMCGMPVEDVPCTIHYPVAPDAWQVEGHNPQSRKIGEARHGCFVHCPVFRQCKAAGIEVRSAVLAGTYYTDAGKVSDWQPAAASCRHCRPGGA